MWKTSKTVSIFAFVLAGVLCGNELLAQTNVPAFFQRKGSNRQRTDSPTVVESATMSIDIENNVTTLLGNVVVDDQDVKITCDKMIIYLEDKPKIAAAAPAEAGKPAAKADDKEFKSGPAKTEEDDSTGGKQLKKVECFGEVIITRRADPKDPKAKDQVSTSDYALYDLKTETVELTGRPVLTSGTDRMNCEKIIIHMDTSKIDVIMPVITYHGDTALPQDSIAPKK